jgi:shikimate dehydrogenase
VGYPTTPVDLVMNATSAGLNPQDPLPWDVSRYSLKGTTVAFDMIYRPAKTLFLAMAEGAGCRTANGLGMLLFQGAKSLELWSGQVAPVEVMRRALLRNIYGDTPQE